MTDPDALLELFAVAARAVRDAVSGIDRGELRARTDRAGQYALDLVADTAACAVLEKAGLRILSEESGITGPKTDVTLVLDPVDGSTNCARGISYWSTSLCAIDRDGALAALVANHANGVVTTAIREGGAYRDGVQIHAAPTTRIADSVVALGSWPRQPIRCKQVRVLGSIALELCDVAAGGLDAHVDASSFVAPWDYLGGYLACLEAGAVVRDASGAPLVTIEPNARRQIIAAATPELADELAAAL
jgi:fructose-1,6-bisphosphatase/inositol monophosphatase family enzyme